MKRISILAVALALSACSTDTQTGDAGDDGIPSGTYAIDPENTYLTFYYLHQGYSYPLLRATDIAGELEYDADNLENSSVIVSIATNSIRSNLDHFDDELASRKFFNADRYPHITFRSERYEAVGENQGIVHGQVTIRGITQPLELGVKLNAALIHPILETPVVGFSATGALSRSDFGLDRNVPVVSDTVEFRIETEFMHGSTDASKAAVATASQTAAGM